MLDTSNYEKSQQSDICHDYQCVIVKINKEDTIAHQKKKKKDFRFHLGDAGCWYGFPRNGFAAISVNRC